jgi:hypothetical protein
MINVFGGVKVWKKDGYYVFMSVKKEIHYADKKPVNKKKKIT